MGSIETILDFVFHIDKYLSVIIQTFGSSTYVILFLVVFCETGLVITPFLPGDSLIFVAATFSHGPLNAWLLFVLLSLAPILGDTVNYWIGLHVGDRMFTKPNSRIYKREHLERANRFYARHGAKAIVMARFIPVLRTIAPFAAGLGKMSYRKFVLYNVLGGISWVATFVLGGYYFGDIPAVRNRLSIVILGIIAVSLVSAVVGYVRSATDEKSKSGG